MTATDRGVLLLDADGGTRRLRLAETPERLASGRSSSRTAFAAAHVVPLAWAGNTPGRPAAIDWDATLAFRRHLWACGLGVADAMDTAQRNMGMDWAATAELIRRSAAEARSVGGDLVVGVNTDHLPDEPVALHAVADAYLLQLEAADEAGAGAVLMASRHLAAAAHSSDDYLDVYRRVLDAASGPVFLHWLGSAFDTRLAGYFGSLIPAEAAEVVLALIHEYPSRVCGIKMSLLDADMERAVRARLPESVRMFTGDDFHYVDLIRGEVDPDGVVRSSDALLGAFAAFGPRAASALQALDDGDTDRYERVLRPTEALARHVFASPTQYYKTGIAFLAWLNGHQPAFQMVGGLHAGRDLPHLSEIIRLADAAGALERPDLAADRWSRLLGLNGLNR